MVVSRARLTCAERKSESGQIPITVSCLTRQEFLGVLIGRLSGFNGCDVKTRVPCLSVVVQYMIMAACCLCRDPVSTDHRRRKKLHGASCTTARTVLREVSSVLLEALVETRDQSAVLCYSCERILNNIQSLTAKVETLRAEVRGKVSALQSVRAEKRQRPAPEIDGQELPQTKHTH